MKKICLCITNYNKEYFLERAIRSCLSQIQNEFQVELIVVNDGSKKFKAKQIIKEFTNIKVLTYKRNKGVSFASNLALKSTNADYFMRVDADDYISVKTSLLLSEILNHNPKIPFVYGDILKIQNNGINKRLRRNNRKILLQHGAGVMFRTKYLKNIKGYNKNLRNCEDFDLILRMQMKYGEGYHIPIAYYRYYVTNSAHLSKSPSRKKYLYLLKKKYAKYLSKGFI
jgi:glycosyltransferase involved in cell wall biosynthesis